MSNSERFRQYRKHIELQILPRFLYHIEINPKSRDILTSVREQLKYNPTNVIIYFNHVSYGDPIFAGHIAEQISTNHSHKIISPASYSHTDPDNKKNSAFFELVQEAQRCGIEIHRVIQHYQIGNPEYGYTKKQAVEQNSKFIHRLRHLHQIGQPTICLISPEGHRSESGTLIQAERGIELIGSILAPVVYLPIGITYPLGYERDSINLCKHVSLTVGSPIAVNQRNNTVSTQYLMEHLATSIPESMQGFYSQNSPIFSDTNC
jgi:hypothetical protein